MTERNLFCLQYLSNPTHFSLFNFLSPLLLTFFFFNLQYRASLFFGGRARKSSIKHRVGAKDKAEKAPALSTSVGVDLRRLFLEVEAMLLMHFIQPQCVDVLSLVSGL